VVVHLDARRGPRRGTLGVIDTWHTTVDPFSGARTGALRVDPPGREFTALHNMARSPASTTKLRSTSTRSAPRP
jgi:uncharacterized protein DUF5605